MNQKVLFIDRDGTIISESHVNFQIDFINKLIFEPNVIHALFELKNNDYHLIMVTNQDSLGTLRFPKTYFDGPHNLMMQIFSSHGIEFDDVLICPHTLDDNCNCRKPKTKMVEPWLIKGKINTENSYVIGDSITDIQLAKNMGIKSIHYGINGQNWNTICQRLTKQD